jgi:hypothetical protein
MRGRSALFKLRHGTIMLAMHSLLTALTFLAAAQAPAASSTATATPSLPPPQWNPAADYITTGQDEPGYRAWYGTTNLHAIQVRAFNKYLIDWGVGGIVPTWQMLRTATSWEKCGAQPFEVPPMAEWPHIVQTLRYIHDYVIPAVGPVEPVSGYRNPILNQCAGGAPESAHKHYSAIDLVPLQPTTREHLMRALCAVHGRRALDYEVGLGFYAFLRFHVDTTKYRRWNMDPAVANQCPPIVRPADIATVAQPLQPQTQPASTNGVAASVTIPVDTSTPVPAVATAPVTATIASPPAQEPAKPQ